MRAGMQSVTRVLAGKRAGKLGRVELAELELRPEWVLVGPQLAWQLAWAIKVIPEFLHTFDTMTTRKSPSLIEYSFRVGDQFL